MKWRSPSWSLPLLAKEMVEQANRRRTYWHRLLYALVLFGFWLLWLYELYQRSGAGHLQILGEGAELFTVIVGVQLAAIFLFLPAMLAGSITQEKENNTLQLLLITDLRPWQILVQKLLSRVLPLMAMFFLALPLTAVAYLFGGVDVDQVWASVYLLMVMAMQVGAASVVVAVHCRTTMSAVLACYLLGPVILMMALFANVVVGVAFWGVLLPLTGDSSQFGERLLMNAFPFVPMFTPGAQPLWATFFGSLPAWCVTLFMLWMARDALGTGATSDSPLEAASLQTTAPPPEAMGLSPRIRPTPHDRPVAWQQTEATGGRWQTIGIAFGAAMLSAMGMYLAAAAGTNTQAPAVVAQVLMVLAWPMIVLVVLVTAARTVALERSRQTIGVLLTTPLTGVEIVRQKLAAVRRWLYAGMTLLVTLALMSFAWMVFQPLSDIHYYPAITPLFSFTRNVLAAVIYLPLFMWFGTLIGLTVHSPAKATLLVIAAAAAWCVGALMLPMFFVEVFHLPAEFRVLTLLSPMGIAFAPGPTWMMMLGNFVFWGAVRWALQWHTLRHADQYLGRPKLGSPEDARRPAAAAEVPGVAT